MTCKRPRYEPPPPKPRKSTVGKAQDGNARSRGRSSQDVDAESHDWVDPPPIEHKPALQFALPSGLRRFYHVHRWGVPHTDGPIAALTGNASDDEVDEDWRLDESRRRMRSRPDLSEGEADFMTMWNAHVQSLPPLVSDRMLPEACRRFALAHAASLRDSEPLRAAFREHLSVTWQHNLLHRDDVQDCLILAEHGAAGGGGASSSSGELVVCSKCSRPVHDRHCALYGRVRGAAAWPIQSGLDLTEELRPDVILQGGPMSALE